MGNPKRNTEFLRFMLTAALLGAAVAWPRPAAAAEQRVALVIGNSAYPSAPLRNPVNDAKAMADKLRVLGFEVMLRTNATQKDINRAVVQFGQKLTAGSVGLFYYAGHGLQVRGKNFLIPVDAEIENEASVRSESVDVDQVLDQFASSRLSMVILDACRNNPFERRFRAGQGGGLAQIDAPKGTLIAYSTAPGKTAADGAGSNGVYTEQLLKAMDAPGLKVEDVFKQVRINVARATQDQQIPWEASSLTGEFFFRVPIEKPALAAPAPTPAPQVDPAAFEMAFWDSIKASTNRAEYEAYLEQYPKGKFAALARSRIKTLEQQTPASARPLPAQTVTHEQTSAETAKERAELIKALDDERKMRDRDAETVKQEMERLRAELLKLRDTPVAASPPTQVSASSSGTSTVAVSKPAGSPSEQKTQIALASPTAASAATPSASFAAEWTQRIALFEKSRGQLTFSKAMAILLDLNAAEELTLLLTHEADIKIKRYHGAYAMGTDNRGNLVWGSSWGWKLPMFATDTARELCARTAGDSCRVVMLNAEFLEKDFVEVAKQLGAQSVAAVRQAYTQGLRKNPPTFVIQYGSTLGPPTFGMVSIRE
jgi:uncharacterized caspase-like protein